MNPDLMKCIAELKVLTGSGLDSLDAALQARSRTRANYAYMDLMIPSYRAKFAVGYIDQGAAANKADLMAKASPEYKEKVERYTSSVKEKEDAENKVTVLRTRISFLSQLLTVEQTLANLSKVG